GEKMKNNKQRGFSLIEVSTVIAVSTVVAGMAIWLVHASMQKSRDGQRRLATQNTIARLAETFRRDAHAATTITAEKPTKKDKIDARNSAWTMDLADGRVVRYRLEEGNLIRSEFAAASSKEKQSKPINRDCFELPSDITASIKPPSPSQPRIATILVSLTKTAENSTGTAAKSRFHSLRIDAAMSTDARFDQVKTQNNKKSASSK
ncbi:MAG: prepilin-type N-terminal cleavage/methylation domain-containing protein, partial [Pirellulales bacterium]|nr:prepilin-type N-terminal cleavage/methylation domain-containing protein [Pirellulales bacterium]